MENSVFLRLFSWVERRRSLVVGLVFTVLAVAGISLVRIQLDNTLDMMMPTGSPAQRMLAFLREANFSNKIVISLEAEDTGEARSRLLSAADDLAESLRSPLITKVTTGFVANDLVADTGFFLRHAPQILTAGDLAEIDAGLTSAGVSGVVQRLYYQLLKPEGMFMARAIQSDPLGINMVILARMEKLSTSMGYDVALENGHFISRDGRHTMLLLDTTVPLTDAAGSRRLLDFLGQKLKAVPPGIKSLLVCGHTHVVSNEDTIKRDLGVVMSLASIAFIILYIVFFRDVRALMIFVIPALAAVVALAITALFFPRLSYFVIAFGPIIAGIADDYGIAVYVAIRHGVKRADAVRHIVAPVTAGCVTTAGIFFAFFFSRIPGYYQLAWFCILSLLLTLVLALYFLPLFLRPGKTPEEHDAAPSFPPPKHPRIYLAVIAVLFVISGALATRIQFDTDVTRLDGTDPAILQAEKNFHAVWGTGERKEAMLVVMGDRYEEVLEKNDALFEQAVESVGATQIVSLASVWPSAKTRATRARAWTEFWQNGREKKLRALLAEAGAARGFSTNAFDLFLGNLYNSAGLIDEPVSNRMLVNLKDRFVQKPNDRYQTVSFFPDKPLLVESLNRVLGTRQDASVISRTASGEILSKAFTGEIAKTSFLAGLMIILMSWLFIRSLPLTLVALSPAFAAVVGLLAVMAVAGRPLSIANLISGIIVFGLSIDFGMHILHACRHPQGAHARVAVTFAAITTIMGGAALLFAHHPALYSVGLTLTIGVGLGYVAAMWMVPVLYEVMGRKG